MQRASSSRKQPSLQSDSGKVNGNANDGQHQTSDVRLLKIPRAAPCIENYGFNLTRSKWDPYPWVCGVTAGTPAALCGLNAGDCVLEVNGLDVLGMRVLEVSKLVKSQNDGVTLLLWNSGCQMDCDKNSICKAPMPTSLNRLTAVLQRILSLIECPVCMNTITPPAMQCQNGHLLCLDCRIRAEKCPVCRDFYTPRRALIAEQIYLAIGNAFEMYGTEDKLRQKLFSGDASTASTTMGQQQQQSSKTNGGQTSRRQRKPLLPTNKFLTKLLPERRTYSLENLCEGNAALLQRTNLTDGFNSQHRQERPACALAATTLMPSHNVSPRHFSFSANDLQQATIESRETPPGSNTKHCNRSKANSLPFVASMHGNDACKSQPTAPSSVNGQQPMSKPHTANLIYHFPCNKDSCYNSAFRLL